MPVASATDSDDQLCIHSWCRPVSAGDWGRGGDAPRPWHSSFLWHARRDVLRLAVHAGILHQHPQLYRSLYQTKAGPSRRNPFPSEGRRSLMNLRLLFSTLFAAALVGCAVGPNYHRPATPEPATFANWISDTNNPIATNWWHNFNDPTLER